ncbi:carbon-nitrogen hydrolase family protein [Hydrogenimonas cancrithermarum]|uniref:Carbon-nitrogen hydrolase n=1 Tax=Hydrogenimonas cancrithermarum TaxID=2993563 RepID=A0ABN6WX46_9BACT|nr:carbon-nitrogen hydrolase family protein [Hydrogenimonas cancrithermarum]BDY13796.1 carbon-nitrogen hydrolase [Hydrogenimonas cancrithermarum]
MINLAALQMPTQGMSPNALDHYFKTAKAKDTKLILLGEYVLNHFFKELEKMPVNMIKDQSDHHLAMIKALSKKYEMVVVAPLIQVKNKVCYKTIVKVTPKTTHTYYQQILIDYGHWDEAKFFANEIKPLEDPMVFAHEGVRFGVIGGFEIHFNWFFDRLNARDVDVLLLPTAATFESHNRWREILKTRAFLHNIYILRANRVGEYLDNEVKWKFYGDSMLITPVGEVESVLEDKESLMVATVDRKEVREAKRLWGFEKQLKKRQN